MYVHVCMLWHDSFFSFNGIQNVFIFHKGCVTFVMLLCFLFIKIWVELCCITVSYTIRSKVIGILISFWFFVLLLFFVLGSTCFATCYWRLTSDNNWFYIMLKLSYDLTFFFSLKCCFFFWLFVCFVLNLNRERERERASGVL